MGCQNMYLISFLEDNLNKYDPTRGGNNLIVLTNEVFNCQGRFIDEHDEMEDVPSPYWI